MTEFKVHAEIAIDPVRLDEVVILHGEFVHETPPFRFHREGGAVARKVAAHPSYQRMKRQYALLREACTRCVDRGLYEMAELWRGKAQDIHEKACSCFVLRAAPAK